MYTIKATLEFTFVENPNLAEPVDPLSLVSLFDEWIVAQRPSWTAELALDDRNIASVQLADVTEAPLRLYKDNELLVSYRTPHVTIEALNAAVLDELRYL